MNPNDIGNDDIAQDDDISSIESPSSSEDLEPVRKSNKYKLRKVKSVQKETPNKCVVKSEPHNYGDFDPSNQVDSFLLSIGATLKTFSPYHLNLAKSKIFNVVQEHDLQQIVTQENSAYREQEHYDVDVNDIKNGI